jgi:hypothetical protein
MKYRINHTAKRAILCAVICMGTFPFYEAPVHAAPTSTGGLTYTEETDSSGTTWYTFSSGTSTGAVAAVSGDHLKFSGVTVTGNITIYTSDTDSPSVSNSAIDVENSDIRSSVYAGYAVGGNVTSNSVTITGTTYRTSGVYGGYTTSGNATENEVELTSSSAIRIYGGYTVSGEASNNVVSVSSNSSVGTIYGGYTASSGDASNNVVSLSSNSYAVNIYGGRAATGNASNNTVSISESETANIYGGYVSSSGDVSGNTVTISDSATIDGYDGFAYGGHTVSGNATGNTVTISSMSLSGVYGGDTTNGDAAENTVILSDVTGVYEYPSEVEGGASNYGDATNNTVTATNSALSLVVGGVVSSGNASGNTVEITSSTVAYPDEFEMDGMAYAGYVSNSGDATDNSLTITSSTVTGATGGGYTASGDATNNSLTITSSTVSGTSAGGYTESGDASSNTVTLTSSTTDDVYGGYTTDGNAISNIVTLGSTVNVGDLFGGYTAGSGDVVTGNTLNVTGLNNQAASIQNFDTMNFYVPAGTSNGDTMLTVSGTTTIPSTGLTATAYVNGSVVLYPGEEITLLSGAIDTTDGTLTTAVSGTVYQGVSTQSEALIETRTENDSGDYIKLVIPEVDDTTDSTETTLNEQTKSIVETPTYTAALVASGGDFLVDSALWNAAKAVKLNSDWTWTPFVDIAYKNMRYNTGSHVESDGWNTILGIARRYEDKSGSFLVGPFVEYGNGDYDSYIDGGIHANGNAHYVGGGIFAQKHFNSGWYIDGSVRGGRVSADYNSNDLLIGTTRVHEDYDYRTPYYGFHLGFGKVHNYGDIVRLDTYLRYMYAHQSSFDAKLATGENYEFDDVDSSKIRVGTRYIHDEKDLGSWYVGAAYQYEFDNESTAHFDGADTPSPSVQGSSGMMELGWEGKGGKNVIYDLSLRGWLGKQEGASVRALVKWTF